MEHAPDTYRLFVGVDIAAATMTAAWQPPQGGPGAPHTYAQTPAGHAALQQQLRATGVPAAETLIVLEATGSYWVALAVALHEARYCVAVINPLQAHHFAKAHLRRAKTDNLDAQALAQLAVALRPAPWTPVLAEKYIRASVCDRWRRLACWTRRAYRWQTGSGGGRPSRPLQRLRGWRRTRAGPAAVAAASLPASGAHSIAAMPL